MTSLQKLAVLDPRLEVSESFKKWFVMLGAKECAWYQFPTTQYSPTNMSFNISIPNNNSCLIDRHSAILALPVTITLGGTGGGSGNIYQPLTEGLRCRPFDKIVTSAQYVLNGTTLSYQVNEISNIQSVFDQNPTNSQMIPTMVDPTQAYSGSYNSARSPFASFTDNVLEITRASYPITVVSNTTTSAEIRTTLYQNLFDWGVFSDDPDVVGINLYPFSIVYTLVSGAGLARIWSRDTTSNTQNLTTLTVSFGQPQITMCIMSLPQGQNVPREITYPYHRVEFFPTSTPVASPIAVGSPISLTSQLIQFQSPPSKIYVYLKPSTNAVYSSIANAVSFTDCFASILRHNYIFGNRTNLLSSQSQVDIFAMTKRNGLPAKFSWCDWCGQNGSVVSGASALMGAIVALDPVRDFGGDELVGMPTKLQFQAHVEGVALNPNTVQYDLGILAVYDGVLVMMDGSANATTTVITSANELQLSPMSYNQLKTLVGGSRVGDFFKNVWGKIKSVASPVVDFLKRSKILSSVASMIPANVPYIGQLAQVGAPILKSLGMGDGDGGRFYDNFDGGDDGEDGGWMAGEGAFAGDDGDDGGVLAGGRRLRRSSLARKMGRRRGRGEDAF
jgi:hypothetical protein